jgi:hypothetical protein
MYDTPTPEEFKSFMVENNLTGADISAMTGVNSRSARRWVAPAEQKGAQPIPWAVWALIQILTGKVKKDDLLKTIGAWKKERQGRGLYERGIGGRPPIGFEGE